MGPERVRGTWLESAAMSLRSVVKRIVPRSLVPVARRSSGNPRNGVPSTSPTPDQRPRACTTAHNRYGAYCVPESSRHRPAAQAILAHDVWEPDTIEFIRQHCASGDVVHAGAYFGDFLPALSKGVAPGARVWAFEPNAENYHCATRTVELNQLDNVVLVNAGVGARAEVLQLQTSDSTGRAMGGASRIVTTGWDESIEVERVQILTIDEWISPDRDITILQLDVEGHEREALVGAMETIRRCRPVLILETCVDGGDLLSSDWFARHIVGLGYRKVRDVHENSVFACGS